MHLEKNQEWSCKLPSNEKSVVTGFPPYGSRIVFKLYWDIAPLACENFATLCTNGGAVLAEGNKKPKPAPIGESGKGLTYRRSAIHRVVRGFIFQGGDFVFGEALFPKPKHNAHQF
jgi:cyclophilin family peptidyl-prolyl cis-trans isomerase